MATGQLDGSKATTDETASVRECELGRWTVIAVLQDIRCLEVEVFLEMCA